MFIVFEINALQKNKKKKKLIYNTYYYYNIKQHSKYLSFI